MLTNAFEVCQIHGFYSIEHKMHDYHLKHIKKGCIRLLQSFDGVIIS